MAFFDEAHIRAEAAELFDLYQRLMQLSMGGCITMETKIEYLEKISRVVELQKIMYFRAKYSEEKDAAEFVQHLTQCANMLGYDGHIDEVFVDMEADIHKANEILKNQKG